MRFRIIRSTLRHIFTIILPIVTAVCIIMCPWLVRAFGEKYVGAVPAMRLLLMASIPKAISTVYYAYCRIQRNTNRSAIMQAYVCIATLSAVVLAQPVGLTGICVAIVGVQTSIAAISSWALRKGLEVNMEAVHKVGTGVGDVFQLGSWLNLGEQEVSHIHVMHVIDSLHGGGARPPFWKLFLDWQAAV